MRARIVEDEEPAIRAAPSSRDVVEEHIADAEERRFVEPRLAHLLGLEERERRATARTSSPPGGCSSSGWPERLPGR